LKDKRVRYIFQNEKTNPETWLIATCSKLVQRLHVEKDGTTSDKAQLPLVTRQNQSHKEVRKRRKALLDFPTNPGRQQRQNLAPGQQFLVRPKQKLVNFSSLLL
jgi:hypothetical protein